MAMATLPPACRSALRKSTSSSISSAARAAAEPAVPGLLQRCGLHGLRMAAAWGWFGGGRWLGWAQGRSAFGAGEVASAAAGFCWDQPGRLGLVAVVNCRDLPGMVVTLIFGA